MKSHCSTKHEVQAMPTIEVLKTGFGAASRGGEGVDPPRVAYFKVDVKGKARSRFSSLFDMYLYCALLRAIFELFQVTVLPNSQSGLRRDLRQWRISVRRS